MPRRLLVLPVALLAALPACDADSPGSGQMRTAAATPPPRGGAAGMGLRLTRIGSFSSPVYVIGAPGDRRRTFVVEQRGEIRVLRDGRTLPAPFLDNFGWRVWGGQRRNYPNQSAPGAVFPELVYPLGGGRCAVTGGYVVRDPRLGGWQGRYLYGDHCGGRIRSVSLSPGRARGDRPTGLSTSLLTSFGEDSQRRLYVASQNGPVYGIDPR